MFFIFLVSLILYLIYVLLISNKAFHMLQQNRYNRGYRYIKWILKKYNKTLLNFNLVYLIFIIFLFNKNIYIIPIIIFILITLILMFTYINKEKKENYKLPLKFTSRIKRLIFTNTILYLLPIIIILIKFDKNYISLYYLILGIIVYLNYFIILLDNFINKPIEHLVNIYFKKKALKKMSSLKDIDVIGITGSYGKTSTKNVVYDILETKFNVYKTPLNYNTPYGLMITINNYLDKYNDYFIAEMGACKVGDIKELCDLVKPKYGIITNIGLAHLETFGSEENIKRTKFELIESLPKEGIGILNKDDKNQENYKIKNKCKILWIGIDNNDVDCFARDIKLSSTGTKFKVKFKEDNKLYDFETKLLGKNNIYNILSSIILGKELGMSIEELQKGVRRVKPIEHRLSLTKYYDVNIIDDAYNSNPSGAKMALEVLNLMPGKHIIVTPGIIELGEKEYEINKQFGRDIADNVDEVILIGKRKTEPIYAGLVEKKFPKEKIYILNNVMDAFPLMLKLKKDETYVLLENDLPDSFNESEVK